MARPLHILWDKPTDEGAYSGGAWLDGNGLALANLKTQDITELARTVDADPASTWFRIDFGRIVPLSMFAFLNHNGSPLAKRRHLVSNSPDGGAPVYDTGFESMASRLVWGSLPFGGFPLDGVDRTPRPGGQMDLHIAPAAVYGRYLVTHVNDPDNPAGYVQAGRFLAGEAFAHRCAYGAVVRPVDPSEVRRTRGGRRVVRRLPGYREVRIAFECMTEKAAWGVGYEIESRLGKRGDFLLTYAPDGDPSIRDRGTAYVALTETVGITNTSHGRYGWAINAEELT